ncbi:MAG: hypothetical protein PHQ62_01085 [Clostridia bacterium]|nr:hypothetical protein [Clostridia bacterium]
MKVLESSSKFKILSDRFIGVYFDKNKRETSNDEADYTLSYWQIYDAKSCVIYPDKFASLIGFSGDIGVVQGVDEKYKYIKIENNKIKFLGSFKKASLLACDIGVVENKDGTMSYIFYNNGEITQFPQKFNKCFLPSENYGIVENFNGKQSYVYITKDGITPITQTFQHCEKVKEGVGRIMDTNNRWHYAVMNGENINVLYDSFLNCFPIKEGIGRVVNDDNSMNYVKLANNEVIDISKPFKNCFEFSNGIARVVHQDGTHSFFKKGENGELKIVLSREYDKTSNRILSKCFFPKCEDIENNTTLIVNRNEETISYATYENGELDIKAKKFKNANALKDNVGKVEYVGGGYGYVYNDNGNIIDLGGKYTYCKDFSEGFGIVSKHNKQCYVKVASKNDPNNKFKLVEILSKKGYPQEYDSCEDYKKGFGVVLIGTNKFAVVGKDGKLLEETPYVPAKIQIKLQHESNNGGITKVQQAKRDRIRDTFFSK